jgi:hypothetical protein
LPLFTQLPRRGVFSEIVVLSLHSASRSATLAPRSSPGATLRGEQRPQIGCCCGKLLEVFIDAKALLVKRVEYLLEKAIRFVHALRPSSVKEWGKRRNYSRAESA